MFSKYQSASAISIVLLSGCASMAPVRSDVQKVNDSARAVLSSPPKQNLSDRVVIRNEVLLPVVPIANENQPKSWLSHKQVTLKFDHPVAMSEVVKALWKQGINISSQLPLETYTYAGMGVHATDAETAMRVVFGAVGLDYKVDNSQKTVEITPVATRTWSFPLNKRSGGSSARGGTDASRNAVGQGGVDGQSSSSTGTPNTSMSSLDGGAGTGASSSSRNQAGARGAAASADGFWDTVKEELDKLLEIPVPVPNLTSGVSQAAGVIVPEIQTRPGIGQNLPSAQGSSSEMFVKRKVGTYAVNPDTGAITVRAPRWLLDELDPYFKRVHEAFNTSFTFTGQLVLVTTDMSRSAGLDISSFMRFANSRYGLTFQNNGLNGVTVSQPTPGSLIPLVTTGAPPVAGTLLGITSPLDGLQVFNAYLESIGDVEYIQNPTLTTANGRKGRVLEQERDYVNTVSQNTAAGGTGSAAVGTTNTIVPIDFGTVLEVTPVYDVSKGIVRAQIDLDVTIQTGTKTINQSLNSLGGVAQIPTELPRLTFLNSSGEVLLRDGDLIIVGGQTKNNKTYKDGGVTNLKDGPLGGIFGQRNSANKVSTYYFALRVSVQKRDAN